MPDTSPRWLDIARCDLGQSAIPGPGSNPRIMAMFAMCGRPDVRDDETPYCAAAVGSWLLGSGLDGSGSLLAKSYLDFGTRLDGPRVGAIAVMEFAPGQHHVGLVDAFSDTHVDILGGNQGLSKGVHEVNVSRFRRSSVRAYRWPVPMKSPADVEADGSRHAAKGKADVAAGWLTTVTATSAGVTAVSQMGDASASLASKLVANPWPWVVLLLGIYLIASGHLVRLWRTQDENMGRHGGRR